MTLRRPVGRRTGSGRFLVAALGVLALALAAWRLHTVFADPILPGQPWQGSSPYLGDFRDLIYGPGRYLLAGGNVYDPQAYTAATPGSPEFDPYAPAWLMLSVLFCGLPYLVGGLLYETFGLGVLLAFAATVARLARLPRLLPSTLALFCLFVLWYPTRAAASGSSLIVALGVLVAVECRRARPWLAAVGMALALVKPQFGLPVGVLMLAVGAWRPVVRGVALLVAASAPALAACVVAAGGPGRFVDAVLRDAAYASSPDAATGLGSPQQFRIDLLGIVSRLTGYVPSDWVELAVPVGTVAVGCAVLAGWRLVGAVSDRPGGDAPVPVLIVTTTLLCLVHFPYDLPLVAGPAVVAAAELVRAGRPHGPAATTAVVALLALVLHVHSLDAIVFPRLATAVDDAVDTGLVALSWLAALLAVALGTSRGSDPFRRSAPARTAARPRHRAGSPTAESST